MGRESSSELRDDKSARRAATATGRGGREPTEAGLDLHNTARIQRLAGNRTTRSAFRAADEIAVADHSADGVVSEVLRSIDVQPASRRLQRVMIGGENRPNGFMAMKHFSGSDRAAKAIIDGFDSAEPPETFDDEEAFVARVTTLLPAAEPEDVGEGPSSGGGGGGGGGALSWRRDAAEKQAAAAAAEPQEPEWSALGEWTVDDDRYEIQAHQHVDEAGFHLKFDAKLKYLNIFFDGAGAILNRDNVVSRAQRDLGIGKNKAQALVKHALAIASNYAEATAQAVEQV